MKHFDYFIAGKKFLLRTDHSSLQYIKTMLLLLWLKVAGWNASRSTTSRSYTEKEPLTVTQMHCHVQNTYRPPYVLSLALPTRICNHLLNWFDLKLLPLLNKPKPSLRIYGFS